MRDFNFFAPYQGKTKQTINKKIYVYTSAIIITLLIFGTLTWNSVNIFMLNRDIAKYNTEINSPQVQEKVKQAEEINKKLVILDKYNNEVTQIITVMGASKYINSEFLDAINSTLPQDVSLKTIAIDGTNLSIQGTAKTRKAIGEFEHNVGSLENISNSQIGTINGDGTDGVEYTFDLKCTLKDVDKNESK